MSQRARRVTIVERGDASGASGWFERDARGGEQVSSSFADASFPVDSVYEGIELDAV